MKNPKRVCISGRFEGQTWKAEMYTAVPLSDVSHFTLWLFVPLANIKKSFLLIWLYRNINISTCFVEHVCRLMKQGLPLSSASTKEQLTVHLLVRLQPIYGTTWRT